MRLRLIGFAVLLAAMLGPVAAMRCAAVMLGDPAVPFHARCTITVNGQSHVGTIDAEPGHQRHEQAILGLAEVFLLDIPAARGYLVLPTLHSYVEFPFPALMAELDSPDLLAHPEGKETVAGIPTTKYRVDHRARDGSRAIGFLWVSRQRILMKLDVSVTRHRGGRKLAVAMQLSHVVLGPVDPALFVLPQGLQALPSGALGPLLGGRSG
jgi:hypothetical protein